MANITAMFDRAGQTLKRVKVRLQTISGQPVVLTRAGSASKYAGQILITDGGPFGQNKYYGRIDLDGNFYGTNHADAGIVSLISEFAEQPQETAGKYGRLTGGCCFCSRTLKDERSLTLGYGPICAGKFGLL